MQSKDLQIVLDTAKEYGAILPSASLDAQLYQSMLQNGMGLLDNSAVIEIIEKLSNEHLHENP